MSPFFAMLLLVVIGVVGVFTIKRIWAVEESKHTKHPEYEVVRTPTTKRIAACLEGYFEGVVCYAIGPNIYVAVQSTTFVGRPHAARCSEVMDVLNCFGFTVNEIPSLIVLSACTPEESLRDVTYRAVASDDDYVKGSIHECYI